MKRISFICSMLIIIFAFSSRKTSLTVIRGVVVHAQTGACIGGATIMIKGSQHVTTTDVNGFFSLNHEGSRAIISIAQTGYYAREIWWQGQKEIEIKLKPKRHTLDEVMVTELEAPLKMEAGDAVMQYVGSVASSKVLARCRPRTTGHDNHETYDFIQENIFHGVAAHPTSTFSIDVDHASYSNIRRFLSNNQRPPIDAVRIEEMVNYFKYNYPEPDNAHPVAIYHQMAPCPWNRANKLLRIGIKARSLDVDHLPASNLVFLLDVSGSMQDENKLPLLKKSFEMLLNQMRPHDRVAIVTYAGSSGIALPSTPASEKGEIRRVLEELTAGGSTAGAAGIISAYELAAQHFIKGGNNRVILATDGDFNVGVNSDSELIRLIEKKRSSGIYLSVLGFGQGNYKEAKMQKLALHGNGNHYYIDGLSEAKKVFVTEFCGSIYAVADDVKIQLEFNPQQVSGYRLIGYENRMLKHEDFKNDKKDAGEIGAGHQVTALYEIVPLGTDAPYLPDSNELKYNYLRFEKDAEEWVSIKLRYKHPTEQTSNELAADVHHSQLHDVSGDFYWSAAVAAFGMILRGSEFRNGADIDLVLDLARRGKNRDPFGYRSEFIQMVEGFHREILAGR